MMKRSIIFVDLISILCLIFIISSVVGAGKSSHFVLVHRNGHGAWSWYKVATMLQSYGHNVTAIDLTASGIDPRQTTDIHSPADYYKPLMDLMMHLTNKDDQNLILVAHTMGGPAISKAMETFPHLIDAAVFVAAPMPGPSLNISTLLPKALATLPPQLDNYYIYGNGPDNPPTASVYGPKYLATYMYQFCPPEDLTLAYTLVRPEPEFTVEQFSKEIVLTNEKYGTVFRVFIAAEEDVLVGKEIVNYMLVNNRPDKVIWIKGSGHMVMFSKPIDLVKALLRVASLSYRNKEAANYLRSAKVADLRSAV
ncbi:hypothetical protein Sjap_010130 [Stephania japonica]|uniref:AB hydrolase-1 domain-containing protein n=1 Tax=Stephania japonica TaxID=461633 RepID=A0AAP0J911_9MAGN